MSSSKLLLALILLAPCDRANQSDKAGSQKNASGKREDPAIPPRASHSSGISQPSPAEQERGAKDETQDVWQKAFAPEYWRDWALVIIGVIGSGVALKTLKAIERQVAANQTAAEAARLNAEAAQRQVAIMESQSVAVSKSADASMKSAESASAAVGISERQSEYMRDALAVTRQAANAASDAATTAKESLRVTERAYVEIVPNLIVLDGGLYADRDVEIPADHRDDPERF